MDGLQHRRSKKKKKEMPFGRSQLLTEGIFFFLLLDHRDPQRNERKEFQSGEAHTNTKEKNTVGNVVECRLF